MSQSDPTDTDTDRDRDKNNDIVYMSPSGTSSSGNRCYHTNRDCFQLTRAKKVMKRPKDSLWNDTVQCPTCKKLDSGEYTRP